jgi:hypothetical protein
LIKDNQEFKLSLQTHKIINVKWALYQLKLTITILVCLVLSDNGEQNIVIVNICMDMLYL